MHVKNGIQREVNLVSEICLILAVILPSALSPFLPQELTGSARAIPNQSWRRCASIALQHDGEPLAESQ